MDVWSEIAATRRELADYLETLDDKAWSTDSLCAGWKVRDVAGHLLMPLETSMPKIMLKMASTGFNFDRANDKLSRDTAATHSTGDLVSGLRANAEKRFKVPGAPVEMPLADAVIHSSDIRRPLGAPPVVPGNRAEAVLDFLVHGRNRGFVDRGRLDGLRFEASDIDWSSGNEGLLVRGPSEALIMAISGRAAALDDLEGEGVAVLRSRG